MKYALVIGIAASSALALPVCAQDATPKPKASPLRFDSATTPVPTAKAVPMKPGEKMAAAAAAAAEAAVAAVAAAATPAQKPAAKPEEKPATKAPEKPAAKPAKLAEPDKPSAPAVVTSTVPPEPAQIIRAFFTALGNNDIDGGYAGLMKGSKIDSSLSVIIPVPLS